MQTDIHASSDIRTTIPVSDRTKIFHALDRFTTVIGKVETYNIKMTLTLI
jgi:hypothetical protein